MYNTVFGGLILVGEYNRRRVPVWRQVQLVSWGLCAPSVWTLCKVTWMEMDFLMAPKAICEPGSLSLCATMSAPGNWVCHSPIRTQLTPSPRQCSLPHATLNPQRASAPLWIPLHSPLVTYLEIKVEKAHQWTEAAGWRNGQVAIPSSLVQCLRP